MGVRGGGEVGERGREVEEKGEGSGVRGGKWGMPTPLSTPSISSRLRGDSPSDSVTRL